MADGIEITVNGARHRVVAAADTPLLYVLRDEISLNGPKFGCGLAQCGACTVHVGDRAVRSCVTPVSSVRQPVTTLEGLGTPERPHPVQAAFIAEQALQCGYCTNGMIMEGAALLSEKPNPTEAQIRQHMNSNLCRCGCQQRVVRAVQRAARGGV